MKTELQKNCVTIEYHFQKKNPINIVNGGEKDRIKKKKH